MGDLEALRLKLAQAEERENKLLKELQEKNTLILENGRHMNLLFVQAPFALTILEGPEFIIEVANEKALELWDRKKEQVQNKKIFEAFPELLGQGFKQILEGVYTTGIPFISNENPIQLFRKGRLSTTYINFVYEPIRDAQGKVNRIMGIGIEITDQVVARQKIEEAELRSRLAIEAADMGAFDWDLSNQVFYSSPRLIEIFGFKGYSNANHEDILNTLHPDDKPVRDKAVEEAYNKGSLIYEVRVIWMDKSIHWIRVYGKIIHNENKELLRMYGIVMDITEQKSMEERLRNSNQELAVSNAQLKRTNADLDNFIYTASHDLKAPISNLEGLFNTLISEVPLNEELAEIKGMIDHSFDRFKNVIKDLTDITKIQKEDNSDLEPVQLEELLGETLLSIPDLIEVAHANIETNLQVKEINFSRKNCRSILYNLISNAIKYRSPQRTPVVTISSYTQGEYTVLEVADNGLGLSAQNQQKIFGMFKRVHDHVEGSGIGLYIVKRIVDNAGGKIELESEVDRGSAFKIFFRKGGLK